MKKIPIIIILLFIFLFVTGCNKTASNTKNNNTTTSENKITTSTKLLDVKIIENSKPFYKILIPTDAGDYCVKAANELKILILESTGAELEIVRDNKIEEGQKYFSLGDTVLKNEQHLEASYDEFGRQGFAINTIDDNLYIYSARDVGVLYGVYEYLSISLNYDFYYTNIYEIDKVKTLYLNEINIKEIPDIEVRVAGYGYIESDQQTLDRMRMTTYSNNYAYAPEGGCWHNWYGYINPNKYGQDHPEYFNTQQNQLCYTAHGNKESFDQMVEITANTMFDCFKDNDKNEIVMAIGDVDNPCTCDECKRYVEKYGAMSSTVIIFLNTVASKLEKLFKDANDERADSFIISFYAYYYVEDAPVSLTYDSNGNAVLHAEKEMFLSKHVAPQYAAAYLNYCDSISSKNNQQYHDNIIKWNYIGDNIHLWAYDQYFRDGGFMFSYNTFYQYPEFYKFIKENNVKWAYLEGQWNNKNSTGFSGLKGYLQSKIAWNVDADIDYLIDKYFNAVYGSKSKEMKAIFDQYIALLSYQISECNMSTIMGGRGFYTRELWPRNIVMDWYNKMVSIEEKLIQNNEIKQAKMVSIERISPLYALIRLYSDSFDEVKLREYISEIKYLLNTFNITEISQEEDTSVFLASIGA